MAQVRATGLEPSDKLKSKLAPQLQELTSSIDMVAAVFAAAAVQPLTASGSEQLPREGEGCSGSSARQKLEQCQGF